MFTLHLSDLEKSFGAKTVFSSISFEHEQLSLGIAGSNGSGKSTFLKCLAFLLRPSDGDIEWIKDGHILSKEQFRVHLGYAAPYINLYDELSCRENLEFLAKVRHETTYRSHVDEWIEKTGLTPVTDQPFGSLSTGQQQRLRIASALFHQPDILLLDEPGSNLDSAGKQLIARITESFKTNSKLLIVASNDQTELNLCDRIFSIEKGRFLS